MSPFVTQPTEFFTVIYRLLKNLLTHFQLTRHLRFYTTSSVRPYNQNRKFKEDCAHYVLSYGKKQM